MRKHTLREVCSSRSEINVKVSGTQTSLSLTKNLKFLSKYSTSSYLTQIMLTLLPKRDLPSLLRRHWPSAFPYYCSHSLNCQKCSQAWKAPSLPVLVLPVVNNSEPHLYAPTPQSPTVLPNQGRNNRDMSFGEDLSGSTHNNTQWNIIRP